MCGAHTVTLLVASPFCPNFLRWWRPINDLVSVCRNFIVSTLISGENNQILTLIAELVELFAPRGSGNAETLLSCPHTPMSPLLKLLPPNIFIYRVFLGHVVGLETSEERNSVTRLTL